MDGKCLYHQGTGHPDAVNTKNNSWVVSSRTVEPTKLQDVLMGFVNIADELLKETIGKSLLNRRRVQFQVLEPSGRAEVKYGIQYIQRLLEDR